MPRSIVFFDSDALIAGSASKTGAANTLIQLSELNFIDGIISERVFDECSRNLQNKMPEALDPFKKIVSHSVKVVPDPTESDPLPYVGMAHEKDLIILASAIQYHAKYLVTFNNKHYFPASDIDIKIVQPGDLLSSIRSMMSDL